MQDSKYTFIDLFSGCGGLSLGFEMAGYKSLLGLITSKMLLIPTNTTTPMLEHSVAICLKSIPKILSENITSTE